MVEITVFSHPQCTSCKDALSVAEELREERSDVEVEVISLASESGQDTAQEMCVLVVPTVIVGDQKVQKAPSKEEMVEMVEAAK